MQHDEQKTPTPTPDVPAPDFGPDNTECADPNRLLLAVNESAHAVRNGWVFFLALTAFFFVTVAGVTHKDLLLNSPVALPILQVGIALKRFFLFAPLILVLVHFAVLLQYAMLARKTRALHFFLEQKEKPGVLRTHPMRLELSSYFFVQAMAGPTRSPLLGTFLTAMSWLTLGLFPLALLLFIQIAFLPFHDAVITWSHRAYLTADFLIILSIGIFTRFPEKGFWSALWGYLSQNSLMFTLTFSGWLAALAFSFGVATIPGYWMEQQVMAITGPLSWNVPVPYNHPQEDDDQNDTAKTAKNGSSGGLKKNARMAFLPTAYLFEGVPDRISGKATSWFSRNIMVTDMDLVPYADEDRENANEVSLHLRGRDLTYAYFDRSDLHRADLTGAKLDHASLIETNLSRARLRSVRLTGANLERANLEHADLNHAKIYGTHLEMARLQCANLYFATVIGANLTKAKLQGSNLHNATLQASNLQQANLLGANLRWASLQLSDITNANLQGANLSGIDLTGTNLSESRLQGADMSLATTLGANFNLVQIWQTRPPSKAALKQVKQAMINYQSLDTSEETKHYISTACENSFDRTNHIFAKKRLSALLDGARVSVWANSVQHGLWKVQSGETATNSSKTFQADYTKALTKLACEDRTKGGLLMRKVIERLSSPTFTGDKALLINKLSARNCTAGQKLPASLFRKLRSKRQKTK